MIGYNSPSSRFLEERGREIFRKIYDLQPQFLIEIDLTDTDLAILFSHIGNNTDFVRRANSRACLALAAVHAANRGEPDDTSYIDLFFRYLRVPPSSAWQDLYGPAIVRFLHDVFKEPERRGPYRFVAPIYRHAGVPCHALGIFSRLLEQLLRDYGPVFTRYEYAKACLGLATGLVSDFLKGDAGYEFTRDTARVLLRIRANAVQDVDAVPGFPKGFWPDLLARLAPHISINTARLPLSTPQLVLDVAERRLGVRIPPTALRAGVWRDRRRLTAEWDTLRTGNEAYRIGDMDWQLPWSPQENRPALFRISDGTFVMAVGEGVASPGTYLLVTPVGDTPAPSIVEEDCGYLDWDSDPLLLAWRVRLAVGYREPKWDLVVAGDALPTFAFDLGMEDPSFGANTYIDRLPNLIVGNWSPESERVFLLHIDYGKGSEELSVPQVGGNVTLNVPCPAQGAVWLEPKGRVRFSTESLPRLQFTVIPSAIRISGSEFPTRDDKCSQVCTSLPPGWQLNWNTELRSCGPDAWVIPAGVFVLDGNLTCGTLRVHISWRVPRWHVCLRTAHEVKHIIWAQDLESDTSVIIRAPAGIDSVLTLRDPKGETLLWEAGRIPPSGTICIRAITFRDFLRSSPLPAAELGLRLGANPTEPTGVYWISGTETILDATAQPDWQRFLGEIPQVGACLLMLGRIRRGPQRSCALDFGCLATPIQEFVANCSILAKVLDQATISSCCLLEQFASGGISTLAKWIRSAQDVISANDGAETCLNSFPDCLDTVPFGRWRQMIIQLRNEITALTDIPGMVSEWRTGVRSGNLNTNLTRIAQMPGGWDLTQAALKYWRGFQVRHEERPDWLQAAAKLLRGAMEGTPAVVAGLAKALWLMAIYRLDYPKDPPQTLQLPAWLKPAAETLQRLGMLVSYEHTAGWPDGLGFTEISPADEDGELERHLGRPMPSEEQ